MIKQITDQGEWDLAVKSFGGHPLQLWSWGELKATHGAWQVTRLIVEHSGKAIGGAQILSRLLPKPFGKMLYIPRGPFCESANRNRVLAEIGQWAKQTGAIELKIEPDWESQTKMPKPWKKSHNSVLIGKTATIDLTLGEDQIMAAMTKKTRQYIRKSQSDDVQIRLAKSEEDISACLAIYRDTAKRAGFDLHDESYYHDLAKLDPANNRIYIAESAGHPVSFLWNIRTSSTEFELYGGVNDEGQRLRSNYSLKWHAIREAKLAGIRLYDMNGLLNDGISGFKLGFSGGETDWVGTWDLPLSRLYGLWEQALPRGKKILQKLNRLRGRK